MKPENQNNNQPPIELAPQDAAWVAHVDASERHHEAFQGYQQAPETEEARDWREQRAREFELADMNRQAAERAARRNGRRERTANLISGVLGRRR